jgi:DegV family protein with EDD domain
MLRIVMDSAGDIPASWVEDYDVKVIPINIQFGNKTYLDGVDITYNDFYRIVDETRIIPKTSQPTPQQFIDFYNKIAQPGDTILSIHVSKKLSGTFESAILAARELVDKYHIIPFDSGSGSISLGYMCREARMLNRVGEALNEIIKRLEFMRNNINIILTLDRLDYAKMSGRVKALHAALASILNVKPIIRLKDGALDMADKVRTRSKSIAYIMDQVSEMVKEKRIMAAVVHARDLSSGQKLFEALKLKLNAADLILTDLSISVAANLGPGTVGIMTCPVEQE